MSALVYSSLRCLLLMAFIVSVASSAWAADDSSSATTTPLPDCNLQCQNGGTCAFVSNNVTTLQQDAQQGKLIMTCQCASQQWGGLACDIPRQVCNGPDDDHLCTSSSEPCVLQDDSKTYRCQKDDDCRYADELGQLTGKLCRQRYTEYCPVSKSSSESSSSTSLSFCTNGGKCKSTLWNSQQSQESPIVEDLQTILQLQQQTELNPLDNQQDDGCLCAQHFEGPHCEFLAWRNAISDSVMDRASPLLYVVAGGGLLLLLALAIAGRRVCNLRRRTRQGSMRRTSDDSTGFCEDDDDDDDDDDESQRLQHYHDSKLTPQAKYIPSFREVLQCLEETVLDASSHSIVIPANQANTLQQQIQSMQAKFRQSASSGLSLARHRLVLEQIPPPGTEGRLSGQDSYCEAVMDDYDFPNDEHSQITMEIDNCRANVFTSNMGGREIN